MTAATTTASQAFGVARDATLSRLDALLSYVERAGTEVTSPNWGHVGDLNRVSELLDQALGGVALDGLKTR